MKYSVISVSMNNLPGLKSTYNSIRTQLHREYEWIVIDGASKDGTKEWLMGLRGSRIIWVSEHDKGIFDAMNKGISKATGDYMIFMNSGDEFYNNETLLKINNHIEGKNPKPYFVYGDALDFDSENKTYLKKAKHHSNYVNTMFTSHQAMLFNREFGESLHLCYPLNFKYTADYAYISLFLKNIKNEEQVLSLDFPVCRFLLGGTNEIHRFKALKEDLKIRKQIIRVNNVKANSLYILHFAHTLAKRVLPDFTKMLRYK